MSKNPKEERCIMMEKRNFVTSSRTPTEGASDIDDVLDTGAKAFGGRPGTVKAASASALEKKASAEDEESDRMNRMV